MEDGDLYQEFRGNENKGGDEVKNVHIVFTSRVNLDKCELESHFLSTTNLSELCSKVLEYTDKQNKRRYYDKTVCEHCMRLFSVPKNSAIGEHMKKVKEEFRTGCVDDKVSQLFLDHIGKCKYNKLTTTTMPQPGDLLTFKNQKSLHPKPISIYTDFEASHCSLAHVCSPCMTLYKASRGSRRLQILEDCRQRGHIKLPGGPKCDHCLQMLEETLEDLARTNFCPKDHHKLRFKDAGGGEVLHPFCQTCLDKVCTDPNFSLECNHSKTTPNSALEIISFCLIAIENYGPPKDVNGEDIVYPRLAKEVTYVGKQGESGQEVMARFWVELKRMRGLVAAKWRGKFRKLLDSPLTPADQLKFDQAEHCYGCNLLFEPQTVPEEENEDLLFGPSVKSVPKKVRDHCHRSGHFRGALCQVCNLKMQDSKRPEVDVLAHNMQGETFVKTYFSPQKMYFLPSVFSPKCIFTKHDLLSVLFKLLTFHRF